MRPALKFLSLSPLLLLQGCGFHLINTTQSHSMCVKGLNSETIQHALNTTRCTKQSNVLLIKTASLGQQEVSNSTNSIVKQFQLSQFIVFDILTPNHKIIKKDIKLSVNKPFITNNSAILSSNSERSLLITEMNNELYTKLTHFLNHIKL